MFRNRLVCVLVFFAAFVPLHGFPAAQRPPSAEERASRTLASGLDLLAAGDADGAVHVLNNLAGTSTNPSVIRQAQCLGGAALAMSGEMRSTEDLAGMLNRPLAAPAQATAAVVISECVRQLAGIASRVPTDRRAGLYYYLGLVGADEAEHVRYLREAVKLRPDFGEANYQLAAHLLAQGQMEESSRIFRLVAEQHPEWAEPRANLGIVLNLTGQPTEAAKELREAIKIRPDYAEAHGQLGMALYATGAYDEALGECGHAMRSEPDNPLYYNCTAVILLEKNRAGDALAYARRATELAPSHETFLVVLAAAQAGSGQENDAIATMRKAVAAQPRLRSDPNRLERADLLRGRALTLASQLLQKTAN